MATMTDASRSNPASSAPSAPTKESGAHFAAAARLRRHSGGRADSRGRRGDGMASPAGAGTAGAFGHHDGERIHVHMDENSGTSVTDIPNILVNNGFRITSFVEEAVNLETAFMRLTKGMVQ